MKKTLLILTFASLAFVSCKKETVTTDPSTTVDTLAINEAPIDTIAVATPIESATSWTGKYSGTIPCVSCDGIFATLELREDLTYTAASMFTERDKKPVDFDGKFSWIENGKLLELDAAGDHRKFEVVEGGIVPLDRDGKKFPAPTSKTGIPDNGEYFLKKQ